MDRIKCTETMAYADSILKISEEDDTVVKAVLEEIFSPRFDCVVDDIRRFLLLLNDIKSCLSSDSQRLQLLLTLLGQVRAHTSSMADEDHQIFVRTQIEELLGPWPHLMCQLLDLIDKMKSNEDHPLRRQATNANKMLVFNRAPTDRLPQSQFFILNHNLPYQTYPSGLHSETSSLIPLHLGGIPTLQPSFPLSDNFRICPEEIVPQKILNSTQEYHLVSRAHQACNRDGPPFQKPGIEETNNVIGKKNKAVNSPFKIKSEVLGQNEKMDFQEGAIQDGTVLEGSHLSSMTGSETKVRDQSFKSGHSCRTLKISKDVTFGSLKTKVYPNTILAKEKWPNQVVSQQRKEVDMGQSLNKTTSCSTSNSQGKSEILSAPTVAPCSDPEGKLPPELKSCLPSCSQNKRTRSNDGVFLNQVSQNCIMVSVKDKFPTSGDDLIDETERVKKRSGVKSRNALSISSLCGVPRNQKSMITFNANTQNFRKKSETGTAMGGNTDGDDHKSSNNTDMTRCFTLSSADSGKSLPRYLLRSTKCEDLNRNNNRTDAVYPAESNLTADSHVRGNKSGKLQSFDPTIVGQEYRYDDIPYCSSQNALSLEDSGGVGVSYSGCDNYFVEGETFDTANVASQEYMDDSKPYCFSLNTLSFFNPKSTSEKLTPQIETKGSGHSKSCFVPDTRGSNLQEVEIMPCKSGNLVRMDGQVCIDGQVCMDGHAHMDGQERMDGQEHMDGHVRMDGQVHNDGQAHCYEQTYSDEQVQGDEQVCDDGWVLDVDGWEHDGQVPERQVCHDAQAHDDDGWVLDVEQYFRQADSGSEDDKIKQGDEIRPDSFLNRLMRSPGCEGGVKIEREKTCSWFKKMKKAKLRRSKRNKGKKP